MNERIRELQSKSYLMCKQIVDDDVRVVVTPDKWFDMFAELLIKECVECCDEVANEADAMKNSKFVTDTGRMLHEGMWGGATNSGITIKNRFGVEE